MSEKNALAILGSLHENGTLFLQRLPDLHGYAYLRPER